MINQMKGKGADCPAAEQRRDGLHVVRIQAALLRS